MTATQRFFPPSFVSSPVQYVAAGGQAVITFDPAAQAYLDVTPPQHADLLVQKGWTKLPMAFGATADRPTLHGSVGATHGTPFYDTTLDKPVFWDGALWRDITGTAV
jgi:hypothetical protein